MKKFLWISTNKCNTGRSSEALSQILLPVGWNDNTILVYVISHCESSDSWPRPRRQTNSLFRSQFLSNIAPGHLPPDTLKCAYVTLSVHYNPKLVKCILFVVFATKNGEVFSSTVLNIQPVSFLVSKYHAIITLLSSLYPCYRPWRPIGLREVKAPTLLTRQTVNRWRQGCQPYAPAALYPQVSFFFF
jgi:hypothetical protein